MKIPYTLAALCCGLVLSCGEKTQAPPPANTPANTPATNNAQPATAPEEKDHPDNDVMVHLMYRFNAALKEQPTNAEPAPGWQSLLADEANPFVCADCHKPELAERFAKIAADLRPPETEKWEKNIPFMKKIMAKWMKAANNNEKVKGKLKSELKCTSCHAKVPS